ncbi:MAG: L-serine ammonia-lyase, iron-sulfur-dependent, subunit alpha [Oribacterium sp.]|jgi:L-cysteine desulfidase|nr:L-serine ammonia-lyase, iron-sulfur-dependent, subunit alpha [Oribacterium sp.]
MLKTDDKYNAYISILKEELIPAMGCTEPIALAYAAAAARKLLGVRPERVEVGASGSIIKNVKSVIVPNTGHMKGIEAAVAAGIVAGDPDKELQVLSDITEQQIPEIQTYLKNTEFKVSCLETPLTFDIVVTLHHGTAYSKVRIANFHTNIVYMERNGEIIKDIPVENDDDKGMTPRDVLNMKDIWDFAGTVDIEDIRGIIEPQIRLNMAIAEEGIHNNYGANIGKVILHSYGSDVRSQAIAMAAAGSDARMNGCEMPVIINSGSGNQGITVSVPVIVYAREKKVSEETLYRALVLSNLTAIHEKSAIGRLSAFCGAVNAGSGAGAGIAYVCGGDYETIIHTVVNALAVVSGIVCDGAKASCAAKIASAVDAGILGWQMYLQGQQFHGGDGIVTKGIENTLANVGRLGKDGMRETNNEIIKIMIGQ